MAKVILFDFDGVILDSMAVRDFGFRQIFNSFPEEKVEVFIKYHRLNGGLSRYVKIRWFYESLLGLSISEQMIQELADEFSIIMRKELINPDNLISDCVSFIKENSTFFKMHIVSGSDQEELRFLCNSLKIDPFFVSIHGSPTPKTELVKLVLNDNNYVSDDCILIGDSINDADAARENNIKFYGYNNPDLRIFGNYLQSIHEIKQVI